MQSTIKIAPLFLVLSVACGETTAFRETELGRFEVTVGGENSSNSPSADGTVSLESVLNDPASDQEALSDGEEATNSAIVKTTLSEADDPSSDAGKAGTGGETVKAGFGAAAGPTPSQGSSPQGAEISDQQTMSLCSKLFQGKAKNIRLVRSTDAASSIKAGPETVIAVRLAGNQAKFKLNVGGSEKLAGLCIVAAGNMPLSEISSSASMGQIVYIGRGNQSKAHFTFTSADLDAAYVNLKGNSHSVSFKGVSSDVCSSLDASSSKSSISCE
jgi:hypothetical protein